LISADNQNSFNSAKAARHGGVTFFDSPLLPVEQC